MIDPVAAVANAERQLLTIIAVLVDRLSGQATIERHEMRERGPALIIQQPNGDLIIRGDS